VVLPFRRSWERLGVSCWRTQVSSLDCKGLFDRNDIELIHRVTHLAPICSVTAVNARHSGSCLYLTTSLDTSILGDHASRISGGTLISSTRPQVVPLSIWPGIRPEVIHGEVRLSASSLLFVIASTAIVCFGSQPFSRDPPTLFGTFAHAVDFAERDCSTSMFVFSSHGLRGRNWIANDGWRDGDFSNGFPRSSVARRLRSHAIASGAVTAIPCFDLTTFSHFPCQSD